jgi:lipid-binding SYLF domain-containing protein
VRQGGTPLRRKAHAILAVALVAGLVAACSTTPPTPEAKDELFRRAEAERQEWNKIDPDMEAFVQKRYGFVFFPEIAKGGAGIGGGYGRGVVYEQGQHIGYADLTQGSIGLQLGGQTYSELIVFQDQNAMDRFKSNPMDFDATASAVIATAGAATNARFVDGVAVFVRPIAGAMAEASIGGQRTTYLPK